MARTDESMKNSGHVLIRMDYRNFEYPLVCENL